MKLELFYKMAGVFELICFGVFVGAILQQANDAHQKFIHDHDIAFNMMKQEIAREHKDATDIWSTLSDDQKANLRKWQQAQLDKYDEVPKP